MGRTHEALKRAEKKYQDNLLKSRNESQMAAATKKSVRFPMQMQSDRFQEVKTKLVTSFPLDSVKTIMFTSTAHGDGSSFIAVSLAKTLVKDFRLNVLLIDANLRRPSLHEIFDIENNPGLSDLLAREEDKTFFVKKVGHGGLYLIPSGKKKSESTNLFESDRFERTLKTMREKFDYVILDVPPVNNYAESIVISTKVDGVVLVLESDKTRQQVATRAKREMEKAGAKVLGAILNKRKHYIPEWIYKRL
jgi:capsular exopolysaccharide synthesis family protein